MIHKIASLQSHSKKTLAVILLGVALFRLPGLVIEFYDTDELAYSVWANEILDGATPYIDFIEQKPPVLNYLTAMVYSVAGENNLRALHFFTLIVVLFTCYYIYRISLLLLKSPPAAYFAMVAYGVFITAFDESFMAFNAEIIFQLPVAMACYYFVLYYFEKSEKNYHLMLSALYIVVAVMIKQQGGVILAAMGLYLLGLRPLLSWKNYSFSESFRICLWLGLWFTVFMAAAHGLMYLAGYLKEGVKWMWLFPFVYMKSSQSNIADLLGKYLSRQGALWAVQILLWASLGAFIHSLFRNKELSEEEKSKGQFLLLFFLLSYLTIFLGGVRLYFHYFVQYLLPLVLIAGYQFERWRPRLDNFKYRVLLNIGLVVPVILFSGWHYHDIFKKHFSDNPYSARNVNYLTERKEYKDVTRWIRENSRKTDRIFVWGECPPMYFFANRRIGARYVMFDFVTLDNSMLGGSKSSVEKYKKSRPAKELEEMLGNILKDFKKKKPRYIVDISPSDFNGYGKYPITKYKKIFDYVSANYVKRIQVSLMDIWERK